MGLIVKIRPMINLVCLGDIACKEHRTKIEFLLHVEAVGVGLAWEGA